MSLFRNKRSALVALTVMVVFVAVIVPTCRMVGCSMELGMGAMPHHMSGTLATISADMCAGYYSFAGGIDAAVMPGAESLLSMIAIALFAAIVLMRPQPAVRRVRIHDAAPPPPPEDPRGERLRL